MATSPLSPNDDGMADYLALNDECRDALDAMFDADPEWAKRWAEAGPMEVE